MRLIWNQEKTQRYETGVDHGVFYPPSGPGVVWNGITSVEESVVGGEPEAYYFDGIKYLDVRATTNYQGTLKAFSAPPEFDECTGFRSVIPGFILTHQPRQRFGFSYRTIVDDEIGHKLHIVYNALATPSNRKYTTLGDGSAPDVRTWTIDAVPPPAVGYRPTAHFIVDTTKSDPDGLAFLEAYLYGTGSSDPVLPPVDMLVALFNS